MIAYLGITTSASVDLLLVPGEIAVIAALAITILVKIGPAHYSAAVLSPASSPHQRLTDLTDAMIYGFTAFAGFEAAAALGEEARIAAARCRRASSASRAFPTCWWSARRRSPSDRAAWPASPGHPGGRHRGVP